MSTSRSDLRQRILECLPGEQSPARLPEIGRRQGIGAGVKDDLHPAVAEKSDVLQERGVPGQGLVWVGDGDDRLSGSQPLIEQSQRQCVADPVGPLVNRVERGGGDHKRIRRERQYVRVFWVFVIIANRM